MLNVASAGQFEGKQIDGIFYIHSVFSLRCLPSLKLTAKAPENGWLEDEFPFGKDYFQGLC